MPNPTLNLEPHPYDSTPLLVPSYLSLNQQSFEINPGPNPVGMNVPPGIYGWTNYLSTGNCNLSNSTAQAYDGTHCMAMQALNASPTDMQAACTLPMQAGVSLSATMQIRAATAARNCCGGFQWLRADGSVISTYQGTQVLDSTSAWTTVTVTSQIAPAGTKLVNVLAWIVVPIAPEVHYVDFVLLSSP